MFDTRLIRSLGLLLAVLALVIAIGLRTAPDSAATAPPQVYVVQAGDTLWTIAERHGDGDPRDRVGEIRALNDLPGAHIVPGQSLLLPAS
jgi:LysM repeat protein